MILHQSSNNTSMEKERLTVKSVISLHSKTEIPQDSVSTRSHKAAESKTVVHLVIHPGSAAVTGQAINGVQVKKKRIKKANLLK